MHFLCYFSFPVFKYFSFEKIYELHNMLLQKINVSILSLECKQPKTPSIEELNSGTEKLDNH